MLQWDLKTAFKIFHLYHILAKQICAFADSPSTWHYICICFKFLDSLCFIFFVTIQSSCIHCILISWNHLQIEPQWQVSPEVQIWHFSEVSRCLRSVPVLPIRGGDWFCSSCRFTATGPVPSCYQRRNKHEILQGSAGWGIGRPRTCCRADFPQVWTLQRNPGFYCTSVLSLKGRETWMFSVWGSIGSRL